MKDHVEIIQLNDQIQSLGETLLFEISELLPDAEVELVGSMTVPMAGRAEIDVMVISNTPQEDSKVIENSGYKQGPVVKGVSYLKKMIDEVEIGVQVLTPDHKMIDVHRSIIKILRENDELRSRYESFKMSLSGLTDEDYKKQKSEWLQKYLIPLTKIV